MSFQSIIMSNRKLTNLFMSSMPASFWEKQGRKKAVANFQWAAQNIPAYADFLAENNVDASQIATLEDFQERVPLVDKQSYVTRFPIDQLCAAGNFGGIYSIERTSGSSGKPLFWPKIPEEDRLFPKYIEYAFVQFYNIDTVSTLVIITLAMGLWISGEKMSRALREVSMKGKYKLAVMSPGASIEDTLEIVQKLGDNFEQVIIVGYPPFVKSVIDEGERRQIEWQKLNVKIGLGGEGYSEDYRDYMASKIGLKDNDFLGVSGGYGTAELGMSVGREYPISVLIRKLATADKKLSESLFGEITVPALMQYNPAGYFIEEHESNLLFTVKAGIPLIRYNIRDRGGVIPFDRALSTLSDHGYDLEQLLFDRGYSKQDIWKLPFFYVFGRSDGTVTISGQNIYPENIEAVLYDLKARKINAFKLAKLYDEEQNEYFFILVELKAGEKLSESNKQKLEAEYQKLFLERLLEVNKEYRYVYEARPKETAPIVRVFAFKDGPFTPSNKIKNDYVFGGQADLSKDQFGWSSGDKRAV